jgi:putative phosphoesterase
MNAPPNSQTYQVYTNYCKFGSKTILQFLEGFEKNIDGVIRNEDIEFLHKTRVTSRKLRAALPLFQFCFSKKTYKKSIKEIKKATSLLGEARDLDVQISFIEQYMQKLNSKEEKNFNILLIDHRKCRESIQSSIVRELNKLKSFHVTRDVRNSCEEMINQQSKIPFDPNQVLEKAQWHISFGLDDFLSLEKFVYNENKIKKHHEMRINAKKLRYTMELFAPLYKNNLKKEIKTIKSYQDILGEKHDLEVWMDYIPKFIETMKEKTRTKQKTLPTEAEKALLNFLAYIKEQRKQRYDQFVHLWEENKKANFFDKLRETTKAGIIIDEEKTKQVLANPDVKVAAMSDVHANLQALESVIQDAEQRKVDMFVNAGDAIGFGPYPNEVIELLSEKNVLSVLGNYDLEVIEGKANAEDEKKLAWKFARQELSRSCECYLFSLPRELRLEVAGKKLLVTHGTPESIEEHIYHKTPAERLKTLVDAARAEIIIVGHSHEQFWKQVNGASIVNPGSVGRPGDGNPQTAYAILSFNPFKTELVRLDYNVQAAADALRKKGMPESFAQMLLRGVSLDTIIQEDEAKKDAMVQNCKETVEVVNRISNGYWADDEHFLQVTRLALRFFDNLAKLHKLGERERCWLECAGILHDIGLSKAQEGHHKESAKLILNDKRMPFTSKERRIIASIARYHRKGLPKRNHHILNGMGQENIRKVKILASLLRVADSLDYSHQSIVKDLKIKTAAKRIIVECFSEKQSLPEEKAFNKKKDMFEKVFTRKLVLIWKQQ